MKPAVPGRPAGRRASSAALVRACRRAGVHPPFITIVVPPEGRIRIRRRHPGRHGAGRRGGHRMRRFGRWFHGSVRSRSGLRFGPGYDVLSRFGGIPGGGDVLRCPQRFRRRGPGRPRGRRRRALGIGRNRCGGFPAFPRGNGHGLPSTGRAARDRTTAESGASTAAVRPAGIGLPSTGRGRGTERRGIGRLDRRRPPGPATARPAPSRPPPPSPRPPSAPPPRAAPPRSTPHPPPHRRRVRRPPARETRRGPSPGRNPGPRFPSARARARPPRECRRTTRWRRRTEAPAAPRQGSGSTVSS